MCRSRAPGETPSRSACSLASCASDVAAGLHAVPATRSERALVAAVAGDVRDLELREEAQHERDGTGDEPEEHDEHTVSPSLADGGLMTAVVIRLAMALSGMTQKPQDTLLISLRA
jgi:hypothetical protein